MTPSTPTVLNDGKGNTSLLYEGVVYVQSRPSIFDAIANNKKKILGAIGSAALFVYMVIQSVPELATTYPIAIKLIVAIATVAGFAGAHASGPDTPATPPPSLTQPLSFQPLSSPLTPKEHA